MPPVVEAGEGVGDGEPLQLGLALPLPQACDQAVEHLRQIAYLTGPARREIDREISGGDRRGSAAEARERAQYEQDQDVGHQPDPRELGGDHQRSEAPELATAAERLRPRQLGHRGPAQPGHAPEDPDHFPAVRALVHHRLAFRVEQRTDGRVGKFRAHQVRRADPGPDDQPALVRHQIDVARVGWGNPLQHVGDGVQIDLRGEGADKSAVRLTDRYGEHDRSLAEHPVPVRLADHGVTSSQPGQAVRGEPHAARPPAVARDHTPARVDDHQRLVVRETLADRVEIVA